jgi:hypothetical protein
MHWTFPLPHIHTKNQVQKVNNAQREKYWFKKKKTEFQLYNLLAK